uniref:Uncharacterized protein n=1 Tax=Opuntia streptacantha TaxID=393608 RepID=A0A7C9ALY3_OPUST
MGSYQYTGASSLMGTFEFNGSLDSYRVMPSEPRQLINGQASDLAFLTPNNTFFSELPPLPTLEPGSDLGVSYPGPALSPMVAVGGTWTQEIESQLPRQQSQQLLTYSDVGEEDSGIRLVHALLTCAEAIQCGEVRLAASLVDEMANGLLSRVNTAYGIGKVAAYFVEALSRRLFQPAPEAGPTGLGSDFEVLYHHFYEACPYLKFAHFTANQAILEAFEGHDYVHIIDFSFMNGLQWPALIQALALRRDGSPSLRLTAIGPPLGSGPESIREIGWKLAQLARSMNMRFAFRAVAASRLEDIKPSVLETDPKEALAVNSIMQLHRLLGSNINSILNWVRNLNPKIVTLVEQEANHNQPEFLTRFTEALHYYSTMFDSLETCHAQQPHKTLAEMYIQKEISNIVCCEGSVRVERHEPLAKWQARMGQAGFKPLDLSQSAALRQASMLLMLFSSQGYDVEEREGCLTLGWHSRPLIVTSAWQVNPNIGSPSVTHQMSSSSASSS